MCYKPSIGAHPIILAFREQRQVDCSEFKDYIKFYYCPVFYRKCLI